MIDCKCRRQLRRSPRTANLHEENGRALRAEKRNNLRKECQRPTKRQRLCSDRDPSSMMDVSRGQMVETSRLHCLRANLHEEEGRGLRAEKRSNKRKGISQQECQRPTKRQRLCSYRDPSSMMDVSRAEFQALYLEGEKLGRGGYGRVYSGYRRKDKLPVAIKHIPKNMVTMTTVTRNGDLIPFPLEIVLMLKATGQHGSEGQSAAVTLLDWFEMNQELILVQERPVPSINLCTYIQMKGGHLQEEEAKMVLQQVVEGIMEVHCSGVLHCDIKPENLLMETGSDNARVRIIDFGCGCFINNSLYKELSGTSQYFPPEWYQHGSYRAGPLTVWQLGVLLCKMLAGHYPFESETEIVYNNPSIQSGLSPDCLDLLRRCLKKRPLGRPPLESLLLHPWLKQ